MAAGDVVIVGPTSVVNGDFLPLQPGAGIETVIHNISSGGAMELHFFDGTNDITSNVPATDVRMYANFALHNNNSKYYRVKNVSGGTVFLSADGIQTK